MKHLVTLSHFFISGERILSNVAGVIRNAEVVVFLTLIMFAGTFWGFIEAFLFWYLDDLGASHFLMGWTVAVGMITSLPFLVSFLKNPGRIRSHDPYETKAETIPLHRPRYIS
jgi:hypothetical protein